MAIGGGRVLAAVLLLSVSAYYVLASVPFSYYHFLQFPHFWWLPGFIRLHPLIMAAATVGLIFGSPRVTVYWKWRLTLIGGISSVWMGVGVWLPDSLTYESAALLSWVPLVLMTVASGVELASYRHSLPSGDQGGRPWALIEVAGAAGVLCAGIYGARAAILPLVTAPITPTEYWLASGASLVGHVGVFIGFVIPLALIEVLGHNVRLAGSTRWLLGSAWTVSVVAFLLRRSVLDALMLGSLSVVMLSWGLSVTLVLFGMALSVHRWASDRGHSRRHAPLLSGQPRARTQWFTLTAAVLCLIVSTWVLPDHLRLADWGLSIQKLLVLVTWVVAVLMVRSLPDKRGTRMALAGGAIAASVVGITSVTVGARGVEATAAINRPAHDVMLSLERYATLDTSFSLVLDLVRPAVSDRDFYAALRATGDVTDNRSLRPVPMPIAPLNGEAPTKPPHLFLIVVDSLRPDYLGPYRTEAKSFSQAIDEFARESVVWYHAFTPYAGTSLSEPAIWVGGLIPRANYVQPFSVLNNLEHLASRAGYRQYVSLDQILRLTLGSPAAPRNLEPHLTRPDTVEEAYKFDLCSTVDELTEQLTLDRLDLRPIFVYSQPQNLHIRVLASGYPTYQGVEVGGGQFFKPAVEAIRRLDGCFGTLIAFLKDRGLYEDSIVVLTSDHGDSYGEEGRWGHAFYLVPETLEVPLIMHVPQRLLQGRTWDPQSPAWLTDITPTIYDLLGYGYEPPTPLVGRPLFLTEDKTDRDEFRAGPRLVQSGYSRAFGLLDPGKHWLYTANANQIHEHLYRIDSRYSEEVTLTAADRVRYRAWLLKELKRLNQYHTGAGNDRVTIAGVDRQQ